ncbi:hypothetical protein [Chitinophaga agri]|uniref:Uncharacterized protein n=1 Tax=Chitinophaga agri TaxID=2703787 RepID=A0A6B9ZDM3_9BACT|nr:hypothetical protein [Chitinophaga agri]QHS59859.1 hypothetical protein GWR21_09735 [Chitinophaga agri]
MLKKLSLLAYLISPIIVLSSCENKPLAKKDQASGAIFSGDSGYLTEKVIIPYVVAENLLDTASPSRKKTPLSDSLIMGKYYRHHDHYMVCILHPDEPSNGLILFETTSAGHPTNVQLYGHGIYNYCWENGDIAFGKLQDYFYLITCRTGMSYNGKERYLFKELYAQNHVNPILEFSWDGHLPSAEIDFQRLTSQITISNDSVITDYRMIHGKRNRQSDTICEEPVDSARWCMSSGTGNGRLLTVPA